MLGSPGPSYSIVSLWEMFDFCPDFCLCVVSSVIDYPLCHSFSILFAQLCHGAVILYNLHLLSDKKKKELEKKKHECVLTRIS